MTMRIFLLALTLFVCAGSVLPCSHAVLSQGSTTDANLCPTADGTFYVNVNDQIKWTDQISPTWVETSWVSYQCTTDTAVVTRSAGLFVDNTDQPSILWDYYKIQLGKRTTNAPGVLFVVAEQYSLSCPRTNPSPIVINFENGGLKLTSPESGVEFDIDGV